MKILSALFLLAMTGGPALAQSSLGLSFFEAGAAAASGTSRTHLRATGDYRITGAHGFQLDLSATHYPTGVLGQVDGHIYMMPGADSKYGVFLSLADTDGRSGTIGQAGVEGMFRLSDRTTFEARALAGVAQPGGVDFIAADMRMTRAVGPRTALSAGLALTEFDEAALSTLAYAADIAVAHGIGATGVEVSASLGVTGGTGATSLKTETVVQLGLTWRFGAEPGAARPLADRSFDRVQPVGLLIGRGLF